MSDRTRGEDGGRGPTSSKPPATSVQAKRLPHAAKVAQPKTRSPHPATIAQPKLAFGVPATRPPHPATVVQPSAALAPVAQRSAWGAGKSGVDIVKQPPKPQPKPPPPKKTVTYDWNIFPSARNHYNDGWGAAYGITSDAQLKDTIASAWEEGEDGEQIELYLGDFKTKKQPLKGCNILYGCNWSADGWTCRVDVWHCGPTIEAG